MANKVILNWQRPLQGGDQEVVKRSGRDEPMWVAIHKCMEAVVISLHIYLYLYLKLAKCYVFLIIFHVFSSTKLENKKVEKVLPRNGGREEGGCTNNVYTCKKNIKMIKKKKEKIIENMRTLSF
jgi:hypothetical protein